MNKNDTQEFTQWLCEASDTARLQEFLQTPAVLALAQEFFRGDWEHEKVLIQLRHEPPFPYETAVYSQPEVSFEDEDGNILEEYMELNSGTLVEVIRKMSMFPALRLCRIVNGDLNQYFWLSLKELQYEPE